MRDGLTAYEYVNKLNVRFFKKDVSSDLNLIDDLSRILFGDIICHYEYLSHPGKYVFFFVKEPGFDLETLPSGS